MFVRMWSLCSASSYTSTRLLRYCFCCCCCCCCEEVRMDVIFVFTLLFIQCNRASGYSYRIVLGLQCVATILDGSVGIQCSTTYSYWFNTTYRYKYRRRSMFVHFVSASSYGCCTRSITYQYSTGIGSLCEIDLDTSTGTVRIQCSKSTSTSNVYAMFSSPTRTGTSSLRVRVFVRYECSYAIFQRDLPVQVRDRTLCVQSSTVWLRVYLYLVLVKDDHDDDNDDGCY